MALTTSLARRRFSGASQLALAVALAAFSTSTVAQTASDAKSAAIDKVQARSKSGRLQTRGTASRQPVNGSNAGRGGADRAGVADVPATEQVVVTAQRHMTNVQTTAASVTVVSGAELARRQVFSISGLANVAPNVQVAEVFGPGSPVSFTIRGISSTDLSQSQSRPIAFYIDEGIRQLPLFEDMPLFDIDSVEVLRGPQGVLYGKNATGGSVDITTKQPGSTFSGYLSAGYGNYNRRETEGAVQVPLTDKVSVRLAYTYVRDDGVIDQVGPGGNLDQTDQLGVRASIRYQPTENLDIVLRYEHNNSEGRNVAEYAVNENFASVGLPVFDRLPGARRQGLSFFQSDNSFVGHRDIVNDGLNNQIKWKISDAISLLSITSYDIGHWDEQSDSDGLPLNISDNDANNANHTTQLVQEIRLAGDFSPLKWTLGAFYSHDNVNLYQYYPYYMDPRCGAACNFGFGNGGFSQSNQFQQRRDSYSGYGSLSYDLTSKLTATGGIRISDDRVEDLHYSAWSGSGSDRYAVRTINDIDRAKVFTNTSGELGLTYKLSSDLLGYTSFKQGYRTGAFNAQAFVNPAEVAPVRPETANSYEIGVKSAFLERKVVFDLSGFYTIYHNQQITSAQAEGAGQIYPLVSIPRARIAGAETQLILRPLENLTFNLAAGYSDAIYLQGTVNGQDVAGHRMAASSPWSGSLAMDWLVGTFLKGEVNLHVDEDLQSREYFDVHESPTISDGGHAITNAQVSWDRSKYTFTLWAANLFDTHYFTYGLDTESLGFDNLIRGEPRTFGFRLRRSF